MANATRNIEHIKSNKARRNWDEYKEFKERKLKGEKLKQARKSTYNEVFNNVNY